MINDSTNYHNFATEKHIIILYFQVNQKYKKKLISAAVSL